MKFLETLEVEMYDFSQANLNKVYDTKYQTCGGFKWKFKK